MVRRVPERKGGRQGFHHDLHAHDHYDPLPLGGNHPGIPALETEDAGSQYFDVGISIARSTDAPSADGHDR
jgi:hypothetical protein